MIEKRKIHDLVGIFYRPTYKTFYVNSIDGESFIKPTGIFVSLGITTSMKTIKDIGCLIQDSGNEYVTQVVEISSKKVGPQFLNTVINVDCPQQYWADESKEEGILDEAAAKNELESMMNLMSPEQDLRVLNEYAPKISKLRDLIERLSSIEDGWKLHSIQKVDESEGFYGIYHKLVNYKKEGDTEYRIGILVREKK